MATIRSLAQELGLSPATVSLALRNSPRISHATRSRVLGHAKEVGYHVPSSVAALMEHRRRGGKDAGLEGEWILYLSYGSEREELAAPRTPLMTWRGIYNRAKEVGVNIWRVSLRKGELDFSASIATARSRGIRGVIIGGRIRPEHLPMEQLRDFAVFKLGDSGAFPQLHRYEQSSFNMMKVAVRQAMSRGYRKIGITFDKVFDDQADGEYRTAAAGFAATNRAVIAPLSQETWNPGAFLEWIQKRRPDCLILRRTATLDCLRESGWSVPADLAVIKLFVTRSEKGISGVDAHTRQAGVIAVDTTLELIMRNDLGHPRIPRVITTPPRWQEGETCPARVP